jgi:glutamine amidotransferase
VISPSVVVLDYGSGNVHSAAKALELAGARVTLTSDRAAAEAADGLVVPGVGAFEAVVTQLATVRGGAIVEKRLTGSRPVLGICVGMQVLFEHGVERGNDSPGLGEWPGVVTELDAPILPHMGWNTVEAPEDSRLFEGIRDERFYFVHSYAAQDWTLEVHDPFPKPRLTWAEHGSRFLAAVENGPLSATQFHPEKSGEAGIRLLGNWLRTLSPGSRRCRLLSSVCARHPPAL